MRNRTMLRSMTPWILCALAACGGDGGESAPPPEEAAGEDEAPPAATSSAPAPATTDCSDFPEQLLVDVAMGYQLVMQLGPDNVQTIEEAAGLPDPEAFRTFGRAFERFDTSGIGDAPFQTPDVSGVEQHQLADLLEAALADRDDPDADSWVAFRAFVDGDMTRQRLSMNYYMSEAGCV